MTNNVIATDQPLSSAQQRCLSALLETVLPASENGAMPSAKELDFLGYVLAQSEDFIPALARMLDQFDDKFPDDPMFVRSARLEEYAATEPDAFDALLFRIYDCYYQNDRVRELIGAVPGPPFPRGSIIEPGDLSLLDAVVERSRGYRR